MESKYSKNEVIDLLWYRWSSTSSHEKTPFIRAIVDSNYVRPENQKQRDIDIDSDVHK